MMSDKGKKSSSQVDSLEQLLKSKDQSEKLQTKLDEAVKELGLKKQELEKNLNKQENVTKQLNDLTVEYNKLKVTIDKDKELKDSLSSQVADLKKKAEGAEEEAKTYKKSVLAKDELLVMKDKQLADKDCIISGKDGEVKKLNDQIVELTKKMEANTLKIPSLQDQLLAMQKENEALKLKEEKLNAQIRDINDKYDKLKVKFRDTGDSVLGATMEVEKLKAELKQKDDQIAGLSGRLGSILTGGSGVLTDKSKLGEIFKTLLQKTQRSIRFCVPTISLVESLGLLPVIKAFPRLTVINISGDIKATDEHIVMDLKQKGVIFTQYDAKDRWVLNRDGEDIVIALEKSDGTVIGFYSNEQRIVSILNSAIMEPWVRGIKI